jgi:hypothetical protein
MDDEDGSDSWQQQELFLFSTASIMALGIIKPPNQWILGC